MIYQNFWKMLCDWLKHGMKGDEFLVHLHQSHSQIIRAMLSGQVKYSAIERAKKQLDLHQLIDKPWHKTERIELLKSNLEAL